MSVNRLIPVAVVAAIVGAVLIPVREQLGRTSTPDLPPLALGQLPPPPPISLADTRPASFDPAVSTLVLYDGTGRWSWLGELYATMTSNLAGHFGRVHIAPVTAYRRGEIERHTAVVYVGSTYGATIPTTFLDDVLRTKLPVLWVNDNVLQLVRRAPDFERRYGWHPTSFNHATAVRVAYKGRLLTRWARQASGIMACEIDGSRAQVLASAILDGGLRLPWAVRSRNLTYVAEIPFAYTSETDRVLVFADLLFDALAPQTAERHRALVRLEDINPRSDPDDLREAADYLHARGIPFGFGLSPYYRDPQGREDSPYELHLRDAPEVVEALRYLESKGGVLVGHGYTHQWDGASNPYNGVTGDDVEFYRVTEDADGDVNPVGPLPDDRSTAWSEHRIVAANREISAAGLDAPRIFEFPHYFASSTAYRAAARRFAVRWERSTYFANALGGGRVVRKSASQFFPYAVRDAYGSKVLPENLGSLSPNAWHSYQARTPRDLIRAARANLAIRDGFAAFYFHPFLDLDLLKRTVDGILALGYTFVDPRSL